MSDDGVPRKCEAQTPESCRAGKAEGLENKHFDNSKDAQQAYEKVMNEKHGSSTGLSKKNRKTGNVPEYSKSNTPKERKPATGNVPVYGKREDGQTQSRSKTGDVPIYTNRGGTEKPSNSKPKTGDVPIFTKRETANSDLRTGKVPEFRKSDKPVNRDRTGGVPKF